MAHITATTITDCNSVEVVSTDSQSCETLLGLFVYESFVCENNSGEHLLLMVSNVEGPHGKILAVVWLAGWLADSTRGERERETDAG